MQKIKPGTMLEYSNHAGKHLVKYIKEIEDGEYTSMVGEWNGFSGEVTHECFRYKGEIQSGWKIISDSPASL